MDLSRYRGKEYYLQQDYYRQFLGEILIAFGKIIFPFPCFICLAL